MDLRVSTPTRRCSARRRGSFPLRTSARPSSRPQRAWPRTLGFTPEFWTKLAEQGWLGLVYPEAYGGAGLGFVRPHRAHGRDGPRRDARGPFFSTLTRLGLAILEAGSDAQKKEWLTKIAGGEARVTLAWTEPNARWDAAGCHDDRPRRVARGFTRCLARSCFVPDAHVAQALVCRRAHPRAARIPRRGVSLFLDAHERPGACRSSYCRRWTRPASSAR